MDSTNTFSAARTRNKLSRSQYEEMIAFMENYPALVRGKLDTHFTLKRRQQLWLELTSILNSDPSGVIKTDVKWRKTWSDLKCSAKNKATSISKQLQEAGDAPVQCSERLSDLEERVLKLMGYDQTDDSVECVSESVVKVEPPDESEEAADNSSATMYLEDLENSGFDIKEFRVEAADSEVLKELGAQVVTSSEILKEFHVEGASPEMSNILMVFEEKDSGDDKRNGEHSDGKAMEPTSNTCFESEGESSSSAPLSDIKNYLEESLIEGYCDPAAETEKQVESQERKRSSNEEICDTAKERKRTRFAEADFSVKINHKPVTQGFGTANSALTSDVSHGFEAAVNALTSVINQYIELRKHEIKIKERKLLLKVKQLKARERLARAMERIADAKEKKRPDF